MGRLLVFGMGYSAQAIAARLPGWQVVGTTRDGRAGTLRLEDPMVEAEIAAATHILSSVPPAGGVDLVLAHWSIALTASGAWLGYLSSTGVYGDTGGAWVDESAPVGSGQRSGRALADAAWLALDARVFRLPGIYGPGRSPFDRLREGSAYCVDAPGHRFSRIHIEDLAAGVIAGFAVPAGAYNLADDEPAEQAEVMRFAAGLLRLPEPMARTVENLPPPARAFYAERRLVANGKAMRVLGWQPRYPDYRAGLRALNAITNPIAVSTPPAPASSDQR